VCSSDLIGQPIDGAVAAGDEPIQRGCDEYRTLDVHYRLPYIEQLAFAAQTGLAFL
jgi:hypothetical protein